MIAVELRRGLKLKCKVFQMKWSTLMCDKDIGGSELLYLVVLQ